MIEFQAPTPADKAWVDELLALGNLRGCDYNFTNLFVWQKAYRFELARMGNFLLIRLRGSRAHSALLDGLSVGRYNGQFKPARTSADWISRDTAVVDAYCADPLCRFLPTVGMYHDMMVGLQLLAKPANLRRMDPDTPVYFFSGDRDPVGANGAGVKKVAGWFKDAGVRDLTVKLYPEGRHEMLNETNREAVWGDVLAWLEGQGGDRRERASWIRKLLYHLFAWIRRDLDVDHY